ncbi:MAG: sodium:solute symporter family protein [Bacteroidetes bacterium]|nr:sodium:solute symporter family protein [Bacteroidota bacterium]MBL6944618.1 sodium:solute symporter family protein [Bacteroidales bacterium]
MNWLIFWIVLYLLVVIVLSLRHIKTSDLEQYLVNNRNTRTLPLVFTVLATFVGGGTSIGLMAMGYESGLAAVGIGIAYVIGFMIMFFFAGKIRTFGAEKKIYSLPHFLNHNYTSSDNPGFTKVFSATVSGVNIFIFFFLLAAQFVAMASLLKFAFDIGYTTAAIISAVIVILYTAIAGLSGVIITDMIQFVAIIIMIILIFIPGIVDDTDMFNRLEELPANMLNGSYYGWIFLVALPLFLSWSVLVRMDIWQRILAAKNEKTARRVSIISGLGMLPFYIIFPAVGIAIRIISNESLDPKDVAYIFIDRHSSGFIFGFAIVGLLSALMSSGDSFLNIISISAVKDFAGWGKPKGETIMYSMIRFTTVGFGIIALFVSLVFPYIVDLMVVGISTIALFVPITLFALVSKNAFKHRKAALASILSGFIVNIILFTWGILYPEQFSAKSSFIPAFIIAAIVLIIGITFFRKKQPC